MSITPRVLLAQIAVLLALLVAVEWTASHLTHTRSWPALALVWSIYLAVRLAVAARKT